MSTFGGVLVEFPDMRVDFFRPVPGFPPPLACFLSHVHSDHLAGLESLKSPFIYCSSATKELLLRLERYPHRLNFELGILEARKQTYKHLRKLLKPIPLQTPTRIELQPGKDIQVTLFDANHCTGAVMFLFEGDGKAVLYTGDIRSEPWFVNSLTRNPFLIEYTSGLKTLDCIYLDTTNTSPIEFPTKADGIKELLQKVSKYPPDTVFHFTAWTFGYEEVWMALSRALNSPIHVDRYKLRLYQSLRGDSDKQGKTSVAFLTHEGPVLTGYVCGNTPQEGCLTGDQTVRLHSCEKGMHCPTVDDNTIWIKPIIARTKHGEMAEIGVGGGGGDLAQHPELELENDFVIDQLLNLFADTEQSVLKDIKNLLLAGSRSMIRAVSLDHIGLDRQEDDMSLSELTKHILRLLTKNGSASVTESKEQKQGLPRIITFPYSRHSSYAELCELVRAFRPKDVYACTVNQSTWHEGVSIQTLFGKHCSASLFRHDLEMRMIVAEMSSYLEDPQTRTTTSAQSSPNVSPVLHHRSRAPAAARTTSGVTIQRNSQDFLRPFDASEKGLPASHFTARKVTPPQDISAVSPGLESQSLRRKAILEGLVEREVKRVRLQVDGPNSSPFGSQSASNGSLSGQSLTTVSGKARIQNTVSHAAYNNDSFTGNQGASASSTMSTTKYPVKDISLDDIPETAILNSVVNIRKILPTSTILSARNALIQTNYQWENAATLLCGSELPVVSSDNENEARPALYTEHQDWNSDGHDYRTARNANAHKSFQELASPLISHIPGSEMNGFRSDQEVPEDQNSEHSATLHDVQPEHFNMEDSPVEVDAYTFFDYDDHVLRCQSCGYEVWSPGGFCTGMEKGYCREGRSGDPYFEVLDPEAGPRPAIARNEYSDETLDDHLRSTVVGNYLDDDSSAYDSQDWAEAHFNEGYDEQDSFIDDKSQPDSDANHDDSSSDGETDWKERFNRLKEKHAFLQDDYENLADKYNDMKRTFFGSDFDSESDMEERDKRRGLVGDVSVPDPVVTTLVLSQAEEQSQDSELTSDRLRDIDEAFEVASSADGWHNITMVSTQDNHTHPEIEL